MKTDPATAARALRTHDHDPASYRPENDALARPPLAFDDDDVDATAAWLAHIDAGRIKVR